MRPLAILLCLLPLTTKAATTPLHTIHEARHLTSTFEDDFYRKMEETVEGHGVVAADACRRQAAVLAASLSTQGWRVRRISLSALTPPHRPDAWEREILQRFAQLRASGAAPGQLELAEFIDGGGSRVFRYIRALASPQDCLGCHRQRIPPPGRDGSELQASPQGPKGRDLGGALSLSKDIDG